MVQELNLGNHNFFFDIESEITFRDDLMFDKAKIEFYILNSIISKLKSAAKNKVGFCFEEVVCDFFEYRRIPLIKTKKTRDFGIDGIITLDAGIFGKINLGLQAKYSLIDSNDVDIFFSALRHAELQLGVIVCKDSRRLEKYELNSKLKAILLSKGINVKERLINQKVDVNPVIILKMEDIVKIVALDIRSFVASVYKQ
ncbi:MAG: restriction endonuclease [Nanoarchaeota archaeon]